MDVDKCVFIVKMYGGVIIVSFISIYWDVEIIFEVFFIFNKDEMNMFL